MALPIFRLGVAVGMILLSWGVNAQTFLPAPSDTGAPLTTPQEATGPTAETPPESPALPQAPLVVISEAQTCENDLALLAAEIVRIAAKLKQERETAATRMSQAVAESEGKLQECIADNDLNARTTIALNEKLRLLEEQQKPLPVEPGVPSPDLERALAALSEEQMKSQDLVTQLAAAQDEIDRLTARLAEKGIGPTPGFGYFDNDLTASFMNLVDVTRMVEMSDRVDAVDCAAAIGWTETREGPEKPLRRQVWVWDAGRPMLCSQDRAGAVMLISPRSTDEAHVLIFR